MFPNECVVILAGGKGKRLRPYTTVLPKPLIPIGDVPILEIVVRQLRQYGFRRLMLAVGYRDGLLRSYFGNGAALGVDLRCSTEDHPLGTVGPLHLMADQLPESFLVMNGDILTDLDYRALLQAHRDSGRLLTLTSYQRRIQIHEGTFELAPDGTVTNFREKPTINVWVSIGVYAMSRAVLEFIPRDRPFGMDDLISAMLAVRAPVETYRHTGLWYDIGCPKDLERATEAFMTSRSQFLPAEKELIGVA